MALISSHPGTADSIDADYFTRDEQDAAVLVHIHLDAVDGIARDTMEAFAALPRRGAEVGGLLLGHVKQGVRPTVWIDRYQRIDCAHHFGPQFVLDEAEHRQLEQAASSIARDGELDVVGFYRSHTRSGFQLEDSDFDMVRRYFNDPADLILLVRPEKLRAPEGRFYVHGPASEMEQGGGAFAFRGRLEAVHRLEPEPDNDDVKADTARTAPPTVLAAPLADPPKARRIVPDFTEVPVAKPELKDVHYDSDPELESSVWWRKWWPVLPALLVGSGLAWFTFNPAEHHENPVPTAAAVAAPVRPLGLYVDPNGESWRVSWNPAATVLHDARSVQLIVRDGDDQSRIDLASADLQSGTYKYRPTSADVSFRLEVTAAGGQISAESFRFMKSVQAGTPAPPAAKPQPLSHAQPHSPRAVHRVAPVVPASIRPRIHGSIPVDVRVVVDSRGRVTAAAPVAKRSGGLQSYLVDRAVFAARQWRFEAGAPGSETIHFVFSK